MEETILNLVETAKTWIDTAVIGAKQLWQDLLDGTASVWIPITELLAPMPDWMLAAILSGVLAVAIALAWALRPAPKMDEGTGSSVDTHHGRGFVDDVMAPPRTPSVPVPEREERLAPDALSVPLALNQADPDPDPPLVVKDDASTYAEEEGTLANTVAGDLQNRLRDLITSGDETGSLLGEARNQLGQGKVREGVDLLVQLGDRERQTSERSSQHSVQATNAAADALVLAGDIVARNDGHAEAMTLYRRALAGLQDREPLRRVGCLNRFGQSAYQLGDGPTAAAAFTKAVQILGVDGDQDAPGLSILLNNLGLAHQLADQPKEAEAAFRKALQLDEAALGPDHPDIAVTLNNLALLYKLKGVHQAAEPLFHRSIRLKAAVYQPPDPRISTVLRNLAALMRETGRLDEADALDRRAMGEGVVEPLTTPAVPSQPTSLEQPSLT